MHRILLLLASLLAPLAHAQAVYKVIGADGRITFTDRPPPASPAQSVQPFGARPAAHDAPAAVRVQLRHVEAALQVYHKQTIVDLAKEHCRLLAGVHWDMPGTTAAAAVAAEAATRWHERHAALVRQKSVVLYDQLTRGELLQANEDARTIGHQYMSPIMVALVAERITWCRQLPKTLASREFDLMGDPVLVGKIMGFDPNDKPVPPPGRRP